MAQDQAVNDSGTRVTDSELFPDPKKRKVKKWFVLLDLGETYYARDQEFEYTSYGVDRVFHYKEAYKKASDHSMNIEFKCSSFKLAKEKLVELAEEFPLQNLYIVRHVDLDTVLYPIN